MKFMGLINKVPIIYYRRSLFDKAELEAAQKYFKCVSLLTDIRKNSFVIGRYSMLPFYKDQENEIINIGASLINNYNQYIYIADLKNYIIDIDEYTPTTWSDLSLIPDDGPFILKGETNSRKSHWKTHMYAEDKKAAIEVHSRLTSDSMISYQSIYIRKYIPLVKLMDGINGMPVTKEFRFFVAYGEVISGGYYWSNYIDDLPVKPDINEVPKDFLNTIINKIGDKNNFYTIDIAQAQTGEWVVIELNEGQCAGLSDHDADEFYRKLYKVVNRQVEKLNRKDNIKLIID